MAMPSISEVLHRPPARALWWIWAGACVLAGLACAGLWLQASSARAALDEARASMGQLGAHDRQPIADQAASPRDFTHSLPAETAQAAELATHLQQGCREAGVTLAALTVAQHAATPSALGRVELEVELVGSYRAVKQALGHWVQLGEWATVRSLRLRSEGEPPGAVQAHVVLAAWSRAAGSAAGGGLPSNAGGR